MNLPRGGLGPGLAAVPLLAIALAGCVSDKEPSRTAATAVTAAWAGRVSVKGNEPHTWLALTVEDGKVYELVGDKAALIREGYQNRRLRVEGRIVSAAAAPGAATAAAPGTPVRIDVTGFREVQ